jgi:hypothetical protein
MTRARLVFTALAFTAVPLAAQSQRLTIRLSPAPNQTLHLRTTQDMEMTTEMDPAAGSGRSVPAIVNMHTVLDTTSAIGPTDNDGHYSARMTIDTISATATMNGREMPLPSQATAAAAPVITFSYDENGKVTDVSAGDSTSAAIDAAKQILMRALATMAPMTLSVGESVILPTALNLPMPSAGPAMSMGVAGETQYTLTSVTFDGADRIAHLTSHTASTLSQAPSPVPAGPAVAFDMTMTGDGKSDVNVDRGIILHAQQQSTIEGTIHGGATGQPTPNGHVHGTFTIVSDLVK